MNDNKINTIPEASSAPEIADRALRRKRAGAVVITGIILAFAIYYGEMLVRMKNEPKPNEVGIPMRGLEYYRPYEDKSEAITRLQQELTNGKGSYPIVKQLVDAYAVSKKLKDAHEFFSSHSDPSGSEPLFLIGEGLVYTEIHDYEKADAVFSKATEHKATSVPALKGLANVRMYRNKIDQAEALLVKARGLAESTHDPLLADILGNLSSLYVIKGNIGAALEIQTQAIALHENALDNRGLAIDYLNLAQIKIRLKQLNEAFDIGNKSLEYAKQSGDNVLELRVYALMVMICQQKSDAANMNIYLAKGKALAKSMGIPDDTMASPVPLN